MTKRTDLGPHITHAHSAEADVATANKQSVPTTMQGWWVVNGGYLLTFYVHVCHFAKMSCVRWITNRQSVRRVSISNVSITKRRNCSTEMRPVGRCAFWKGA